ncbi:MAG: PQQ-binding-like beta-propeller repeat protein [Pirellulales bacterium]
MNSHHQTALWFLVLVAMSASSSAADQTGNDSDPLWQLAAEAYQSGQVETGHIHLKTLVGKSSGNVDLAIKCLEEILNQARRWDANRLAAQAHLTFVDNPSAEYAARQLCGLERIGAVSANRRSVQDAFTVLLEHNVRDGRLFEAMEMTDRFVEENPHDPYWRIQQARVYRRLDSSKTRPLFDRLRAETDLDHPDAATRARWRAFSKELEESREQLPQEIQPLPKGSPLLLMEPDDPDGEWGIVAGRSAQQIPVIVDRLAARALVGEQILPWRDKSGLTDPVRALDLHLLSQPRGELEPLRRLQAKRYAQRDIESVTPDAETLASYRRYAWAPAAQQRLQNLANRMLFAGRAQSALRSFREVLDHATDQALRDVAQVGYWTARAQIEQPAGVDELLGDVAADRLLSWLGKPAKAGEICRQLIERRAGAPGSAANASTLKELVQQVVHIPPVAPWSSGLPGGVDLTVVGKNLLVSGREVLAMYDARPPNRPAWQNLQPGRSKQVNIHPGYFRPAFDKEVIYTRWGFSSLPPRGIAAIDRSTGQLLWTNDWSLSDPRPLEVPLGDPVLADGLLYYLQWHTAGDVGKPQGRRLTLVCFDRHRRESAWEQTIATAGQTSDITASLERAHAESAIYGNRVTIHRGAVYSSSNCGIVARSDIRDGRTDWIHHYRPVSVDRRSVLNHGSPPIIAGDKVICMPRDANRVFALDQVTGRLVWENTLVMGVQLVGVWEDLLIVRGRSNVAALHLATGQARWYRPVSGGVLGRASLLGASVCFAQLDNLLRLDVKTGQIEETRPWELANEKPQNFAIDGRNLYVITNRPGEGFGRRVDRPLNPSAPGESVPLSLPLAQAWMLPRENAKIALPPVESDLHGTAYVISEGILEHIDLSPQGRIRWQRFVEVHDPRIRFVGKTILIVDRSGGHAPGLANRVFAFDAASGRTLWEHVIGIPVHVILNCGSTQIFHDAVGRIVAVDMASGRRAWKRNLGDGFQMRLSWDGKRLHIFFVSRLRSAHHMVVDARTGHTISESTIAAKTSADAKNAEYIKGGYYEVIINPVRARYVRLVALSEINGRGWASISELQVVDAKGDNLPRDGWSATASNSETKARYDTSPRCVIDNDPVTWWHSQWIDGIPPHPHEVRVDMGGLQTVTGIRYLPAVIVNNNGMIRDYELYVSQDGDNWGDPVAKGFLVNRTRVDQAYATERSIVFESRAGPNKPLGIYRYPLDGSAALLVQENANIVFLQEPYFITVAGKNLVIHRFDDPAYHFELGTSDQYDTSLIEIANDRLVLGRKGVLVADLAQKRLVIAASDSKQTYNQPGLVLREGADSLLKIVPLGEKGSQGQAVFRFDLRTGRHTEALLAPQAEPFQSGHYSRDRSICRFDGLLLLRDHSTVTAWIRSVP